MTLAHEAVDDGDHIPFRDSKRCTRTDEQGGFVRTLGDSMEAAKPELSKGVGFPLFSFSKGGFKHHQSR